MSLIDSLRATAPPGDELAQIIFDVAFQCEALSDDALCARLYRRSLECRVQDTNIHAGCWFRLGACLERMRSWKPAMECFQTAIRLARDWAHMTDLASLRLAQLHYAAEDFEAAEQLFDHLRGSSNGEIRQPAVRLARSKCLLYLGRKRDATLELEYVRESGNSGEALDAERILAEIHEAAGNRKAAIACYQRILKHPGAGNAMKSAANFRIDSLS